MSGAIVAAVIAAAATYENNQQVAHRQDREAAASLRTQGRLQQEGNQKTGDLIKKTAASNDTGAKANLLQQFMDQMQSKQGNATQPLGQVGNVSDAYTKAANDAALGISQYGADRAGVVSAIDAPAAQRQAEAADLMRYGTDIGQIKQRSASDEFLTNIRLRGIKPNPWLTAVSSAAGAYASHGGGAASTGGGADAFSQGNTADAGGGLTYNMPNY